MCPRDCYWYISNKWTEPQKFRQGPVDMVSWLMHENKALLQQTTGMKHKSDTKESLITYAILGQVTLMKMALNFDWQTKYQHNHWMCQELMSAGVPTYTSWSFTIVLCNLCQPIK